jgi:hypothetical protein
MREADAEDQGSGLARLDRELGELAKQPKVEDELEKLETKGD